MTLYSLGIFLKPMDVRKVFNDFVFFVYFSKTNGCKESI